LDEEDMRTRTVGILGYGIMGITDNMQTALDRVAEWSEANGYRVSQKKNQGHMPYAILENLPDPTIRMNRQTLEVADTLRILGLILDRQLTFRPNTETVKAKFSKRLNLLRHLAGTQKGGG
jgi:hypothetical protein